MGSLATKASESVALGALPQLGKTMADLVGQAPALVEQLDAPYLPANGRVPAAELEVLRDNAVELAQAVQGATAEASYLAVVTKAPRSDLDAFRDMMNAACQDIAAAGASDPFMAAAIQGQSALERGAMVPHFLALFGDTYKRKSSSGSAL
jgi:hypothetical protein